MRRAIVGKYNILAGADVLVGDAVDELIALAGADPDEVPQADKAAIAQKVYAANAAIVRDDPPRNKRRFPLGFVSDAPINPGQSITITSRPQVLFKGNRLVLPSDIAGDFAVDDLKVGKDSQFVAEGAIPGRVLQENATDVGFDLDTAQISQDISVSVTNIGGAPRTFRAALWGTVAE